jgi:hypothetical protein
LSYLLYDARRGPVPSTEQPESDELSVAGAVNVVRDGTSVLYELFADARNRIWAKPREEERPDG